MKPIRKVYNNPRCPRNIYNFEWKDGVMKSKVIDSDFKVSEKTEKMNLETFEKLTDDLKKELNLLGPWLPQTVVYKCRPKIEW